MAVPGIEGGELNQRRGIEVSSDLKCTVLLLFKKIKKIIMFKTTAGRCRFELALSERARVTQSAGFGKINIKSS